jgi:hypothetical protein
MSLLEFLCKWARGDSSEECRLKAMLCGFFERDPRTIRNWMSRTPKYVKWVLEKIDQEWEESGQINYSIFFKN